MPDAKHIKTEKEKEELHSAAGLNRTCPLLSGKGSARGPSSSSPLPRTDSLPRSPIEGADDQELNQRVGSYQHAGGKQVTHEILVESLLYVNDGIDVARLEGQLFGLGESLVVLHRE
jgi:hypothetical protein